MKGPEPTTLPPDPPAHRFLQAGFQSGFLDLSLHGLFQGAHQPVRTSGDHLNQLIVLGRLHLKREEFRWAEPVTVGRLNEGGVELVFQSGRGFKHPFDRNCLGVVGDLWVQARRRGGEATSRMASVPVMVRCRSPVRDIRLWSAGFGVDGPGAPVPRSSRRANVPGSAPRFVCSWTEAPGAVPGVAEVCGVGAAPAGWAPRG